MKTLWKDILTALLMGMVLPGVMLNAAIFLTDRHVPAAEEAAPQQTAAAELPETVALPVRVRRPDGTVERMDMDTYLTGVVLAEMPASFELEALKAQSVAARTYAQKAYETGGKHGDGSVCTDSACCQAHLTQEAYLARGGTQEGLDRVRSAVEATTGQVLIYEGELIEATYFSCSGGSTEDAVAVWGVEYPYLHAVSSPGEEEAVHYTDVQVFPLQTFQNLLGRVLPGPPELWFGQTIYTAGGGVASVSIGGQAYTGPQLRSLLGLRSTAFTAVATSTEVTFTTRGYGHRVGMSQYGAEAMAVAGSDYAEILMHYYPGAELMQIRK